MPRMTLTIDQRSQLDSDLVDLKEQQTQLVELVEVQPDLRGLLSIVEEQIRKAETLLRVLD